MKPHYLRTWSRVGLREEDCDYRSRMIAETYSTVGRSLPLAWLMYGKSTVSDQVETGARRDLQCAYCCRSSLEKQEWALPTWSRVGLREEDWDYRSRVIAEN